FGRQTLPGPFCESQRVLVCDVYNGIGLFPFEVAFRTEWVTPVSTRNVVPPLIVIIERDGVARRREDNGASNQVLRRRAREVLRARLTFSDRDVTGSANKLLKLRIRDVGRIHPEAIDVNTVNWASVYSAMHSSFRAGRWIHCTH